MVLKLQNASDKPLEVESARWDHSVCKGANFGEMRFQPGQTHIEDICCKKLNLGAHVLSVTTENKPGHYCTWKFTYNEENEVSKLMYQLTI